MLIFVTYMSHPVFYPDIYNNQSLVRKSHHTVLHDLYTGSNTILPAHTQLISCYEDKRQQRNVFIEVHSVMVSNVI